MLDQFGHPVILETAAKPPTKLIVRLVAPSSIAPASEVICRRQTLPSPSALDGCKANNPGYTLSASGTPVERLSHFCKQLSPILCLTPTHCEKCALDNCRRGGEKHLAIRRVAIP